MASIDITALLPPSLLLPPRLSAHKYLMICTLTVAAWDTLVLSPRTWRLHRTKEWPLLKINYQILRYMMPIEFIIVAVAFFDSRWSADRCNSFYLFEPIVTAILMTVASASLAIRLYAIFDKSKLVMGVLGGLLLIQVIVQAICCGFYQVVPLKVGQGCIAGPKHNWVGIYWLAPSLFYSAALTFAVMRSAQSQAAKPINLWKLFLRDGLNLYGAIWVVNMVNMLFWFLSTPNGESDTIKTIATSMTAVLTTTMTLRIILGVRGTLAHGGTYSGLSSGSGSQPSRSISHPGPGSRGAAAGGVVNIGNVPTRASGIVGAVGAPTYTIDEMRAKVERDWVLDGASDGDDKQSALTAERADTKHSYPEKGDYGRNNATAKVAVDREVDFVKG